MTHALPRSMAGDTDAVLQQIADYVLAEPDFSQEAFQTARFCLLDSIGCALLAFDYPACVKMLGPVVPGAELNNGARVLGTPWRLDPVRAAFNMGALVRWLDYNDTWLAAEWGHPSDNLGALLAVLDYQARNAAASKPTVRQLLVAMIQTYEIQGVLALANAFNRVGLDHVLLVRIASTAVATRLLGGDRDAILRAVSNAWLDGGALRTYRHAPNTGSRKSWAAGDATSRGVWHALMALRGEMGYAGALTTPTWGFQDALFRGKPVQLARPLGCYVMENILFKIAYPAEFHAQTAVEAGCLLHPQVKDRWDEIERISVDTHESALRIIDKNGPLQNPADRDHCLQYMLAIALLKGNLRASDYEADVAMDPRIDRLREKMVLSEYLTYSWDYLDAEKRSIANAVQVHFRDGSETARVEIHYPLGHRRRRSEAAPLLIEKFASNTQHRLGAERVDQVLRLFQDPTILDATTIDLLIDSTA